MNWVEEIPTNEGNSELFTLTEDERVILLNE